MASVKIAGIRMASVKIAAENGEILCKDCDMVGADSDDSMNTHKES